MQGLTVALLDSVVALEVPAELAERLRPLLPPHRGGPTTASVVVERRDGGYLVRGPSGVLVAADATAALDRVLELCNGTAVEQCADFAVHAGVVARAGRVVALPASSGVGKSTLVACLLRCGWSYVSDEALVLDAEGVVRGYPKWLSLHRWSLERLGLPQPEAGCEERAVPAAELGDVVPADARLRLTDVVIARRTVDDVALTPLVPAAGAVELLRYSFNHYRDPGASVALVSQVARHSRTWSLALADPLESAQLLTSALPADP